MIKKYINFTFFYLIFSIGSAFAASSAFLDKETNLFLKKVAAENLSCQLLKLDTGRLNYGPTDCRSDQVWPSLIIYRQVSLGENKMASMQRKVLSHFNRTIKSLWIANASVINLTSDEILDLRNDPEVKAIYYADHKIRLIDDQINFPFSNTENQNRTYPYGLEKVGLKKIKEKYPLLNGTGVSVGILDSGIDVKHPQLQKKVFLFKDFSNTNPNITDELGHGTFVSGILAGSTNNGDPVGVAPAVNIIFAKIFGAGRDASTETVLTAMQWITDPDNDPNTKDFPRVINASWGDMTDGVKLPSEEPLCIAADNWTKLGIIAVYAAGNRGSDEQTIDIPAGCPGVIAVGASDMNDEVPSFSGRGPMIWPNMTLEKPDITAPGYNVYSTTKGGGFGVQSGASFATPHVTGLVALMLQNNSLLTPQRAKETLIQTATDLYDKGYDVDSGFGRINGYESIKSTLVQ